MKGIYLNTFKWMVGFYSILWIYDNVYVNRERKCFAILSSHASRNGWMNVKSLQSYRLYTRTNQIISSRRHYAIILLIVIEYSITIFSSWLHCSVQMGKKESFCCCCCCRSVWSQLTFIMNDLICHRYDVEALIVSLWLRESRISCDCDTVEHFSTSFYQLNTWTSTEIVMLFKSKIWKTNRILPGQRLYSPITA